MATPLIPVSGLETCVNLIFRFPWSNILHNGVVVVISYVFLEEQDQFITSLLDAGLLRKIVEGLASATPHGYKPHLRQIAAAMQMTQSTAALERFATDPLWEKYWFIMEVRKNTSLTFVEAEREVVAKLAEALDELDGKSPAAAPTPVEGGAPAGAVDVKEPETPVVGAATPEETQTDKVETQVVATESVASTPSDEKPTEEVAKVETPTETTPVTPEAADVHVDEKPKDEVVATTPVESDVKVDEKPVEEPAKVETPAPAAVDEKPVESSNSDVKVDEKSESSNDSTPAVAVVPDADVKPQETTSSDASAAPGEADKSGDASSTAAETPKEQVEGGAVAQEQS